MKLEDIAKDHPDLIQPCEQCSGIVEKLKAAWDEMFQRGSTVAAKDAHQPMFEDQVSCRACDNRRFRATPKTLALVAVLRALGPTIKSEEIPF